jgi:hypothetical protein
MKLTILACTFLLAASAFAQDKPQQNSASKAPQSALALLSQQGCPVRFTDVSLLGSGHIMLTRQDASSSGDLSFQYQNESGKTIQSLAVRVTLKLKHDVYALDATDFTLDMTLTGQGLQETLPLNVSGYVYGLNHVTLERVSYSDGTAWSAADENSCRYEKSGTTQEIAKPI